MGKPLNFKNILSQLNKDASLWSIFVFIPCLVFAQERVFLNLEEDNIENLPFVSESISFKSAIAKSAVSLKKFCPSAGDQKSTGSCAAFAMAYGAMSMSLAIQNNITDPTGINNNRVSPGYVFNHLNDGNCTNPMDVLHVMEFLKTEGSCFEKTFPFLPNNCSKRINPRNDFKRIKIRNGYRILDHSDQDQVKLNKIKTYLSDSIPVVAILEVFDSFTRAKGVSVWTKNEHTDIYLGHHVVVITGYNEITGLFDLYNSWGEDWGINGHISVLYDDLLKILTSAVVLEVEKTTIDVPPTAKRFSRESAYTSTETSSKNNFLRLFFNIKEISLVDNMRFERYPAFHFDKNRNCYQTDDLQKGDYIQLLTSNVPKNKYLYILSIDPKSKIKLHWPKKNKDQYHIPSSEYLTIPSEDSVLKKSFKGTEWLLVMLSTQPININELINDLASKIRRNEPYQIFRFRRHYFISPDQVSFRKNRVMASSHFSDNQHFVLPLFLELK